MRLQVMGLCNRDKTGSEAVASRPFLSLLHNPCALKELQSPEMVL